MYALLFGCCWHSEQCWTQDQHRQCKSTVHGRQQSPSLCRWRPQSCVFHHVGDCSSCNCQDIVWLNALRCAGCLRETLKPTGECLKQWQKSSNVTEALALSHGRLKAYCSITDTCQITVILIGTQSNSAGEMQRTTSNISFNCLRAQLSVRSPCMTYHNLFVTR